VQARCFTWSPVSDCVPGIDADEVACVGEHDYVHSNVAEGEEGLRQVSPTHPPRTVTWCPRVLVLPRVVNTNTEADGPLSMI